MKLKRKIEELPAMARGGKMGEAGRTGELLTQEEVNRLADGTAVAVVWPGGNGPHRYSVERVDGAGEPFAMTTGSDGSDGLRLTKVGRGENQTQVWLLA